MKKTAINLKQIYWQNGVFISNNTTQKPITVVPIGMPQNFESEAMNCIVTKEDKKNDQGTIHFFETRNIRKFLDEHKDVHYHEVNAYITGQGTRTSISENYKIPVSFFKIIKE
jgi:hypothetical protein